MRLLEIATGKIIDAPESYGLRLIEQGKAALAPKKESAAKPEKTVKAAKVKKE